MKGIGNTSVYIYEGKDECPHAPGKEELWQESWVIYFWDLEKQTYVFLRMSQVPNKQQGTGTVWLNAWTPEHQYKNVDTTLPATETVVTEDSICVGDGLCKYTYDGNHIWDVSDGDTKMHFVMKDSHPGASYYKEATSAIQDTLANHIEAVGFAEGELTIAGKTHTVSGPAWRDHSWGPRDWLSVRGHRAFHAMLEDDFHFFSLVLIADNGSYARNGLVIKGDTAEYIQDFEITAYMDEDCVSNKGGTVVFNYEGVMHTILFEPLGRATIQIHDGLACVDTMCRVTMGNKRGVGLSETSNRPQGGDKTPYLLPCSKGVIDDGVFPNIL